MKLDDTGRCCGRRPIDYKSGKSTGLGTPHLFCARCDAAYDRTTHEQIENWAWERDGNNFVKRRISAVRKIWENAFGSGKSPR